MGFLAAVFAICIVLSIFSEQIMSILVLIVALLIIGVPLFILASIVKTCSDKKQDKNTSSSSVTNRYFEDEYRRKRIKEELSKPITGDYYVEDSFHSCVHKNKHDYLNEPCCYCARRTAGPCESKLS